LAGDQRANEHVLLTSMHTLFVREHNRWARKLVKYQPELKGKDELIYQQVRRIICGIMQNITYSEFLPALLGPKALRKYKGYKSKVNPTVVQEFSAVAYRIGHTMVSNQLHIGPRCSGKSLPLKDAFFNPTYVREHGVDGLLLGASKQLMQRVDNEIVDALRNFLFGPPSRQSVGDLATLNIQRARDHGICDYNSLRVAYGLPRVKSYAEISRNPQVQERLQQAYGPAHRGIDRIDPWTGGLCEDHVSGSQLGPLFHRILVDQFTRIRDGDRFWWELDPGLSQQLKAKIRKSRLSDVIRHNVNLHGAHLSCDVFHLRD
jgi:hypothetical protein